MAYISQAATFARFFGRRAFATTTGVRFAVGAAFGATLPAITGWFFDTRGSYAIPFLAIAAVTLIGSVVAFLLQPPRKKALTTADRVAPKGLGASAVFSPGSPTTTRGCPSLRIAAEPVPAERDCADHRLHYLVSEAPAHGANTRKARHGGVWEGLA